MRIVEQWSGGASISQTQYRIVCDDDSEDGSGKYEIQIRISNTFNNESQYRSLGRFEHLKAQQLAAHFILDDKERIERREIRNAFMQKLRRA